MSLGPGYLPRLPDVRCEADSVAEGRAGGLCWHWGHGQLPVPAQDPTQQCSRVKKRPRGV